MFSRAHLLIQRDYDHMLSHPPWGIEALPLNEDNMFEWSAKVLGLRGTPWEGGIFRLYLKFDEYYKERPPEICFHTIPFHPNVDMITGKPCIDFLDDPALWQSYSFVTLLVTVQCLLSEPVMEGAVNVEAVNLLLNSPHAYRQMTQDCVMASQRVDAGLSPHLSEDPEDIKNAKNQGSNEMPVSASRSRARISFEDYHNTWAGIATSKTNTDYTAPLLELVEKHPSLLALHYGIPPEELQTQIEKQLTEHNTLVYGKFKSRGKDLEKDPKQAALDRVNKMRKIYLQPRTPKRSAGGVSVTLDGLQEVSHRNKLQEPEPWEQEVDDLVAWTDKLDTEDFGEFME